MDVKQGVVTLGGTVETQRQKDKATKLAKKVKGVKQVVNNIVLKDQMIRIRAGAGTAVAPAPRAGFL